MQCSQTRNQPAGFSGRQHPCYDPSIAFTAHKLRWKDLRRLLSSSHSRPNPGADPASRLAAVRHGSTYDQGPKLTFSASNPSGAASRVQTARLGSEEMKRLEIGESSSSVGVSEDSNSVETTASLDECLQVLVSLSQNRSRQHEALALLQRILEEIDPQQISATQLQMLLPCVMGQPLSKADLAKVDDCLAHVAPGLSEKELVQLFPLACSALQSPTDGLRVMLDTILLQDATLETADWVLLLHQCRIVDLKHDPFLDVVARTIARKMPAMSLQQAFSCLETLGTLGFQMRLSTRMYIEEAVRALLMSSQFEIMATTQDVTTIARAIRRLKLQLPKSWLDSMSELFTTKIDLLVMVSERKMGLESSTVHEVAACVLCLGHLQHPIPQSHRLFEAVTYALASAQEDDVIIIARGLLRLERIKKLPRFVWNALDRAAADVLDGLTDVDVCHLLHSFGKCRVRPRRLLPLVSHLVVHRAAGLSLHQASILLWSFAMLSKIIPVSDGTTSALLQQVLALITRRNFQEGRQHTVDVANIAWALATLQHNPAPSLRVVMERLMACCRPIQGMSGVSVALMLWACAKAGAVPYRLNLYLLRIGEIVKDLEPFQITSMLWAFGQMNRYPGVELMEALLSALTVNIRAADPQGIGDAVWACGVLSHHPGQLVEALAADLERRGAEYGQESWTAVAWGLTQVGHDTEEILKLAHHQIDERRVKIDLRLVATLTWSAAVFEHVQKPVYKRMMSLLRTFPSPILDQASLRHVREAHLLAALTGAYEAEDLSPAFQMAGEIHEWKAEFLQLDIGYTAKGKLNAIRGALRNLQIPYISHFTLVAPGSGYHGKGLFESIVLDRPWGRNRRVAVEFLSPSMLTVNTHQPTWRVLYRAACLCALGFDVLWLPYSDWDAAVARRVEEEFLMSRIQKLLGIV